MDGALPRDDVRRGFEFQDLSTTQVALVRRAAKHRRARADALHVARIVCRRTAAHGVGLPGRSGLAAVWSEQCRAQRQPRSSNGDAGVRDPKRQFDAFTKGQLGQLPAGVTGRSRRFQLFHTPPSTPQVDGYARGARTIRDRARTGSAYERTPLPAKTDFAEDDRLPPDRRGDEPVPDAAAAARARRRLHRGDAASSRRRPTRRCASR